MIEAYITNLGKYNEGELCGEYLRLPATKEDVQELLSRIGVDGVLYEETFITDYETNIHGLRGALGEYASIDELNYLATLINDMDRWDLQKFEAAIDLDSSTGNTSEFINLAQNLDCYDFYPDVYDNYDLGRYLIDEMCCMEIPEYLENYFDYSAYGRDYSINESGTFVDGGYVVRSYGSFTEHYNSREDLPDEHKIFYYPDIEKMSIASKLNMYQQMVHAPSETYKSIPLREDR
jgi:antirestriction protein